MLSDAEYLFQKLFATISQVAQDEVSPYALKAPGFHIRGCHHETSGACKFGRRCRFSHLCKVDEKSFRSEIQRHLDNGVTVTRKSQSVSHIPDNEPINHAMLASDLALVDTDMRNPYSIHSNLPQVSSEVSPPPGEDIMLVHTLHCEAPSVVAAVSIARDSPHSMVGT